MQLKEHTNASVYFELLSQLDDVSKKALIAHLDDSNQTKSKKNTKTFKQLFGSWKSNETAEELIASIRKSRTTKRKLEAF